MKDSKRPFLHHHATLPHPEKDDVLMRFMVFMNPALKGLLMARSVDAFIDCTFDCTPAPFYQTLIFIVFDHQTRKYVPVVYALMTHKIEHLYWHVLQQIVVLSE